MQKVCGSAECVCVLVFWCTGALVQCCALVHVVRTFFVCVQSTGAVHSYSVHAESVCFLISSHSVSCRPKYFPDYRETIYANHLSVSAPLVLVL